MTYGCQLVQARLQEAGRDAPAGSQRGGEAYTNRRTPCPAALEALAERVPSDGLRVNDEAVAPWKVLNWMAHTCYMGVVEPHTRKSWTQDLTRHGEGASIGIVHVEVALTSDDDIPPNTIYLLSSSAPAPQVVKNPRSTTAHDEAMHTNHLLHSSYVTATYGYSLV
ncbi:hypothetical protein EDB92DRAFT_1945261 [Lactarius akahatsu]|uniref:Uncharacterized protein n=1 Tax=Lactarius akahatsu TaxID=416441 RepID=A0AAD4LI76_9AGAM|nr:hypothetical protein EDB92DRAFT_1945261 [Lactarius akahatsu]